MPNLDFDTMQENRLIPERARVLGLTRCFIYDGPSMMPSFRPGHLLYVRPTARVVSRGDVIVYANPPHIGFVTHRVAAVTNAGVITRGDNNARNDEPAITPEQIIGRVEMVEDNGRLRPVTGGWWGWMYACVNWNIRQAYAWFRRTFGGPYRWLRRSGFVLRLWHPTITRHRINTGNGSLIKYVCGGRVVARWWQQQNRFECDKPYDLVIPRPDEK